MTLTDSLERVFSRSAAKPFRTHNLKDDHIHLDADGQLIFSPDDVEDPKNWSKARRWYITIVAVTLTVNATFASSSPTGCIESISSQFSISEEAAGLVVTLYLLGYCAGPLFWAPLSEFYGRRWIFMISFLTYFAFTFLCAFTPTFGGLLVGRFLCGTMASAALSNTPGVLADLWGPVDRGNAMALFSVMTFAGPALGPVISGFLELTEDWRWNFYVLLWLAFATLIPLATIPETLPSQVLVIKARRIRAAGLPAYAHVRAPVEATDRTLTGLFKVALTRPWIILFDPIALLTAIYLSIVYMLLYMLFAIYPLIFQQVRGFNAGVGELPLIGTIIGAALGGIMVWVESKLAIKSSERGRERTPEDRLPLAMIGAVIFPLSMFWFAWSGEFAYVNWAVPAVAGVFLSTGIMLIFVAFLNYLTDTYLMYAASAIAGNTILRSAFGAVSPLFTTQMFDAMTIGGAGSLIAGVASVLAISPFLFYKYGPTIRRKSRFAPTEDRAEAELEEEREAEESSPEEKSAEEEEEEQETLEDGSKEQEHVEGEEEKQKEDEANPEREARATTAHVPK